MNQPTHPAAGDGAAPAGGWALAVDFGTSNTAAAHTNPVSGKVETLALQHRGSTLSSAVYVESPDRIDVGDVAEDRAQVNPAGFLPSPKRAIPHGEVSVNGYDLPAAVPVAAVLDAVMRRAVAAHNGAPPSRLVLTHPEDWSPREIGVLRDAAGRLPIGSTAVEMVSEPRAAAQYYAGAETVAPGTRIAVFDFGGGTLDVAVLRAGDDGGFEVVAARGDNGLGGKNFDAALRRWLDEQIENRDPELLTHVRTAAPMHDRLALDASIRRAKELLSEAPSATITVPSPNGPERFHITREEFEEVIDPALDRALTLTRSVLADAGPVEALYLTGGSSRIPVVHERLKEVAQIATLDDPKTVVSSGALATPRTDVAPAAAPHAGPAAAGAGAGVGAGAIATRPLPSAASTASTQEGVPTVRFAPAPGGWPPGDDTATTAFRSPSAGADAPRSSGGRAGLILAAVGLVALLALGIGGYTLLTGNDSDSGEPGANGDPGSAEQATLRAGGGQDAGSEGAEQADTPESESRSGSGSGTGPVDTEEGAMAVLPAALRSAVTECRRLSDTFEGGVVQMCGIDPGSPVAEGLATTYGEPSFSFDVDRSAAQRQVVGIRQGIHDQQSLSVNEVVENSTRTAAALVSGDDGEHFSVWYNNSTTGVSLRTEADSVDAAKAFLARAGLLN